MSQALLRQAMEALQELKQLLDIATCIGAVPSPAANGPAGKALAALSAISAALEAWEEPVAGRLTPHQLWRERAIWLLDALTDATRELRDNGELDAMLEHLDKHPSLSASPVPADTQGDAKDAARCPDHADPFQWGISRAARDAAKFFWENRPTSATQALRDVMAERHRQMMVEGWTAKHDDEHGNGELAFAAACYAHQAAARSWMLRDLPDGQERYSHDEPPDNWPDSWDTSWWRPKNQRRDLVRAAALLLAEIERIDRAALSATPEAGKK